MAQYDFHYLPLEGKITGKQVLQQTEDAINDLGNRIANIETDTEAISEAVEIAQDAKNVADNAETIANDAMDVARAERESAQEAAQEANQAATNAANSASSASVTAQQLMEYLATKEELTAPAVDTTLTISGAAADAKVTGDAIKSTKSEMSLFGVDDLLWDDLTQKSTASYGVTWTRNEETKTVTAVGTPTNTSWMKMFDKTSTLPNGMMAGKTYIADANGDENIKLQIFWYNSSGTLSSTLVNSADATNFTIPSEAVGLKIQCIVSKNVTVNGSARPYIATAYSLNGLMEQGFVNHGMLPDGTDLNNLSNNGSYYLSMSSEYPGNPKNGTACILMHYNISSALKMQILHSVFPLNQGKETVYRRFRNVNGWNAWECLDSVDAATSMVNYGTLPDGTDLDSVEGNKIYYLLYSATYPHFPIDDNASGVLTSTFFNRTVQSQTLDLFYPLNNNVRYQRFHNVNGWNAWQKIEPMVNTAVDLNLMQIFAKYVVIGDSLTAGRTHTDNVNIISSVARGTGNNWPNYLALRTGRTFTNVAVGGSSAKSWRESLLASEGVADLDADSYIIGLGANERRSNMTVGTEADIAVNYTDNADSFYGNLDYIVRQLMEWKPLAHIFVMTMPSIEGGNYATLNNVIRYVTSLYPVKVHCIDLEEYSYQYYKLPIVVNNYTYVHFNPLSYNFLSGVIEQAINTYMYNNSALFGDAPYA